MRLANRRDANHGTISRTFEQLGWVVEDTSRQGNGFPDIAIAKVTAQGKVTALVEIKISKGKLRPKQEAFRARWPGKVYVCRTVEDVLRVNDENSNVEAP